MKFVPALACLFCLSLLGTCLVESAYIISEPCTSVTIVLVLRSVFGKTFCQRPFYVRDAVRRPRPSVHAWFIILFNAPVFLVFICLYYASWCCKPTGASRELLPEDHNCVRIALLQRLQARAAGQAPKTIFFYCFYTLPGAACRAGTRQRRRSLHPSLPACLQKRILPQKWLSLCNARS